MGIQATLGWSSGIAAGAAKDASTMQSAATAARALSSALGSLKAAQAKASASTAGGGRSLSGADQLALQGQKLEAASVAQRNAALAKLVQSQAKAASALTAAKQKADIKDAAATKANDAKVEAEAAKHAAKLEQIAANHANKMAQIAAKEAKGTKAAKGSGGSGGKPAGGAAPSGSGGEGDVSSMLSGLTGGSASASVAGVALAVAQKAAELAKQLAVITAGLLRQGADLSMAQTGFREKTTFGFSTLLKSESQASDLYRKASDMANHLGVEKEKVMQRLTKLLGPEGGFSKSGALAAVEVIQAVSEVSGEEAGDKLTNILTRIQAAGKTTTRDILALKTMGVSASSVYSELAKKLGKSNAEIEVMLKKGQISAKQGEEAIEAAVRKRYGAAIEKEAGSIPKLLMRIKGDFEAMFDSVDLSPVKDVLKSFATALEGPEGKVLKGSITELFGTLFHALFDPFRGPKGIENLKSVIGGISEAIHALTALVKMAGNALQWLVDKMGMLSKLGGVLKAGRPSVGPTFGGGTGGGFGSAGGGFGGGGVAAMGTSALNATPGVDALTNSFGLLNAAANDNSLSDKFGAQLDALAPKIQDTAVAIGQGFAQGINDSGGQAENAAEGLAQRVLAKMRAALGVHSPSTEFADIAGFSVDGFAGGFDENSHKAEAAAGRMAANAAAAAGGGMSPSFAGGRGGPAGAPVIQINVAAGASASAGGDQALAEMIGDVVDAKIRAMGEAA